MANRVKFTLQKRKAFIGALYENPNVSQVCRDLGISKRTAYDHKQANEEFSDQWDAAIKIGLGELEDIAFKRATDGSDTMLIFLLKAYDPSKYNDRQQVQVSGDVNVQVTLAETIAKAREAAVARRNANGGSHDDSDGTDPS